MNTFNKDTFNGSKLTVSAFIMLRKILISNKCCSVELYFNKYKIYMKHQMFTTDIYKNHYFYLSTNSVYLNDL